MLDDIDHRPEALALLDNLRASLPKLERLLESASDHWGYEDPIYRFYHQSYKVFGLQDTTERIVSSLQALAPDRKLNAWFTELIECGTNKRFSAQDNEHWISVTRPILEAFFHARFFLEMAVRYGRALAAPPRMLPSGWAAFLYLYDLR
jgi:hypothetical protein